MPLSKPAKVTYEVKVDGTGNVYPEARAMTEVLDRMDENLGKLSEALKDRFKKLVISQISLSKYRLGDPNYANIKHPHEVSQSFNVPDQRTADRTVRADLENAPPHFEETSDKSLLFDDSGVGSERFESSKTSKIAKHFPSRFRNYDSSGSNTSQFQESSDNSSGSKDSNYHITDRMRLWSSSSSDSVGPSDSGRLLPYSKITKEKLNALKDLEEKAKADDAACSDNKDADKGKTLLTSNQDEISSSYTYHKTKTRAALKKAPIPAEDSRISVENKDIEPPIPPKLDIVVGDEIVHPTDKQTLSSRLKTTKPSATSSAKNGDRPAESNDTKPPEAYKAEIAACKENDQPYQDQLPLTSKYNKTNTTAAVIAKAGDRPAESKERKPAISPKAEILVDERSDEPYQYQLPLWPKYYETISTDACNAKAGESPAESKDIKPPILRKADILVCQKNAYHFPGDMQAYNKESAKEGTVTRIQLDEHYRRKRSVTMSETMPAQEENVSDGLRRRGIVKTKPTDAPSDDVKPGQSTYIGLTHSQQFFRLAGGTLLHKKNKIEEPTRGRNVIPETRRLTSAPMVKKKLQLNAHNAVERNISSGKRLLGSDLRHPIEQSACMEHTGTDPETTKTDWNDIVANEPQGGFTRPSTTATTPLNEKIPMSQEYIKHHTSAFAFYRTARPELNHEKYRSEERTDLKREKLNDSEAFTVENKEEESGGQEKTRTKERYNSKKSPLTKKTNKSPVTRRLESMVHELGDFNERVSPKSETASQRSPFMVVDAPEFDAHQSGGFFDASPELLANRCSHATVPCVTLTEHFPRTVCNYTTALPMQIIKYADSGLPLDKSEWTRCERKASYSVITRALQADNETFMDDRCIEGEPVCNNLRKTGECKLETTIFDHSLKKSKQCPTQKCNSSVTRRTVLSSTERHTSTTQPVVLLGTQKIHKAIQLSPVDLEFSKQSANIAPYRFPRLGSSPFTRTTEYSKVCYDSSEDETLGVEEREGAIIQKAGAEDWSDDKSGTKRMFYSLPVGHVKTVSRPRTDDGRRRERTSSVYKDAPPHGVHRSEASRPILSRRQEKKYQTDYEMHNKQKNQEQRKIESPLYGNNSGRNRDRNSAPTLITNKYREWSRERDAETSSSQETSVVQQPRRIYTENRGARSFPHRTDSCSQTENIELRLSFWYDCVSQTETSNSEITDKADMAVETETDTKDMATMTETAISSIGTQITTKRRTGLRGLWFQQVKDVGATSSIIALLGITIGILAVLCGPTVADYVYRLGTASIIYVCCNIRLTYVSSPIV